MGCWFAEYEILFFQGSNLSSESRFPDTRVVPSGRSGGDRISYIELSRSWWRRWDWRTLHSRRWINQIDGMDDFSSPFQDNTPSSKGSRISRKSSPVSHDSILRRFSRIRELPKALCKRCWCDLNQFDKLSFEVSEIFWKALGLRCCRMQHRNSRNNSIHGKRVRPDQGNWSPLSSDFRIRIAGAG